MRTASPAESHLNLVAAIGFISVPAQFTSQRDLVGLEERIHRTTAPAVSLTFSAPAFGNEFRLARDRKRYAPA